MIPFLYEKLNKKEKESGFVQEYAYIEDDSILYEKDGNTDKKREEKVERGSTIIQM